MISVVSIKHCQLDKNSVAIQSLKFHYCFSQLALQQQGLRIYPKLNSVNPKRFHRLPKYLVLVHNLHWNIFFSSIVRNSLQAVCQQKLINICVTKKREILKSSQNFATKFITKVFLIRMWWLISYQIHPYNSHQK